MEILLITFLMILMLFVGMLIGSTHKFETCKVEVVYCNTDLEKEINEAKRKAEKEIKSIDIKI